MTPLGYYIGIAVGAVAVSVVWVLDETTLPRWLPYAINCPLVAAGAALVRCLT